MNSATATYHAVLESLGVLRVRGADAVALPAGTAVERHGAASRAAARCWPGYHNPQGRTIALLRLVRGAHAGDVLADRCRASWPRRWPRGWPNSSCARR